MNPKLKEPRERYCFKCGKKIWQQKRRGCDKDDCYRLNIGKTTEE